jgi:hypothetical protein
MLVLDSLRVNFKPDSSYETPDDGHILPQNLKGRLASLRGKILAQPGCVAV